MKSWHAKLEAHQKIIKQMKAVVDTFDRFLWHPEFDRFRALYPDKYPAPLTPAQIKAMNKQLAPLEQQERRAWKEVENCLDW